MSIVDLSIIPLDFLVGEQVIFTDTKLIGIHPNVLGKVLSNHSKGKSMMENIQEHDEAIGPDFQSFLKKLNFLKQKWAKKIALGDSIEIRLISHIIFSKANAKNYSIISDNLVYYKKCKIDQTDLLQACLCGSKIIAEFLADGLKIQLGEYLGYVCSSPNQYWALALATQMKEHGIGLPRDFYLFCTNLDTLNAIETIFKPVDFIAI